MNRSNLVLGIIAGLITVHAGAQTAEHEHEGLTPAAPAARLELSDGLKQALVEEMVAIQTGMQELIPVIAAGVWREVAEIGRKIHDGYIMHRKLSKAQIEELHRVLPARFKELDHEFHHTAALLADAATKADPGLVNYYFYKLNETCISCHARFASVRFPGLAPGFEHIEHVQHMDQTQLD